MQADDGRFRLNQDQAAEDGTALLGPTDPEGTERIADRLGSGQQRTDPHAVGHDWDRISARLAELFTAGAPDNDPRTQQAIDEHYRWICRFWTPDRESYLRLAAMYANQSNFRRRIERKKPAGLAAYMRNAMITYAWSRLR